MIDENLKKILELPNETIGIMIKLLLTIKMEDIEEMGKTFNKMFELKSTTRIMKDLEGI
jgi:hypothetical protein